MKKNLTQMVFVLDMSGSMKWLAPETIGGYNTMLTDQKKEDGDALVTTVLFSTIDTSWFTMALISKKFRI